MANTVGKVIRDLVIRRDGACRACGLPATLYNLMEADHVNPLVKVSYRGRAAECPASELQCLCRACNNMKGTAKNVPALPLRVPEYDLRKVHENQEAFRAWLESFRAPSKRQALRLAKERNRIAKECKRKMRT